MRLFGIIACAFMLFGCNKPSGDTITVGTISGPETQLVEVAQKVALEKYGLHVKIIEFNDYNLPNEALQDGSLDANVFQHYPYLNAAMKAHSYDFEVIGKTFIYPVGLYSKKVTNVMQLPKHSTIALPNDPSNEARALLLLQNTGIITLDKTALASVKDVKKNPKALHFVTLDAAQTPRVLDDVDAAVINSNYAIPAGLNPLQNAIVLESKRSPYVNLIVIKKGNPKMKQLQEFVAAFQSTEVVDKAKELFGNAALPAWTE